LPNATSCASFYQLQMICKTMLASRRVRLVKKVPMTQ
jgi:hypothetical protein